MRALLTLFVATWILLLLPGCCESRWCCPCPCGPGLMARRPAQAPAPAAAPAAAEDARCADLAHDVPYRVGDTYLKDGDQIEILGLQGDRARLEEGGTYCVWGQVTRRAGAPEAALMVWNANGENAVEMPRKAAAGPGTRPYRFRFRLVKLGAPHLSMYPLEGGTSVASLYFHPTP